ncbi:hypothetical protein BX616_010222 [Lobosporangium transversale]|nr:hypothetical protein BX616_010222 [Lobosporangium transversale]
MIDRVLQPASLAAPAVTDQVGEKEGAGADILMAQQSFIEFGLHTLLEPVPSNTTNIDIGEQVLGVDVIVREEITFKDPGLLGLLFPWLFLAEHGFLD